VDYVECIVIGAGVIGLGIARDLAIAGHDVLLLERHAAIGTETSSRNSEVVHAGLHYPDGSLKARSCVRGRELLYAYCSRQGAPYRRCG
jgi:L-2-hydroxyglutarate oxidase LhgO